MQKKPEIVERSSGYWVVDNDGVIDGPFDSIREAMDSLNNIVVLNSFSSIDDYTTVENKDENSNY